MILRVRNLSFRIAIKPKYDHVSCYSKIKFYSRHFLHYVLIGNIWDKEAVLQILLVDAAKAYPPDATETDYRQIKNTLEVVFILLYRIFLAVID